MARPKNAISQNHLQQIKVLTQQTFGKPLTHSFECEHLSKDIKKVTGSNIGANTLRRLFQFLDTKFAPSVQTLNTLAAYNGYVSWHAFTEQFVPTYQPLTLDQEANLYLEFYKIEMKEEGDMNYHNASRNIAFRILFNPALLAKLSPALAKNQVSQIYFFERFPYIDGLCTDYKRSVQLYLQKKDPEAQIFGNSLLFLSAFLSGRQKDLKTYLDRINKFEVNKQMHPFTVARFMGSNLLYEHSNGRDVPYWITEINSWNKYFLHTTKSSFWHYPYFQHMMADYLNLAGFFAESAHIITSVKPLNKNYEIESGYAESLEVVYQIARHSSSQSNYKQWFETTEVFETINPLFKKFYMLQALCIYRSFLSVSKKRQNIDSRITSLIQDTGFTYFQPTV